AGSSSTARRGESRYDQHHESRRRVRPATHDPAHPGRARGRDASGGGGPGRRGGRLSAAPRGRGGRGRLVRLPSALPEHSPSAAGRARPARLPHARLRAERATGRSSFAGATVPAQRRRPALLARHLGIPARVLEPRTLAPPVRPLLLRAAAAQAVRPTAASAAAIRGESRGRRHRLALPHHDHSAGRQHRARDRVEGAQDPPRTSRARRRGRTPAGTDPRRSDLSPATDPEADCATVRWRTTPTPGGAPMHSFRSLARTLFPLFVTVLLGILLAAAIPHRTRWAEAQLTEAPAAPERR